jgi:hypothetical protein
MRGLQHAAGAFDKRCMTPSDQRELACLLASRIAAYCASGIVLERRGAGAVLALLLARDIRAWSAGVGRTIQRSR